MLLHLPSTFWLIAKNLCLRRLDIINLDDPKLIATLRLEVNCVEAAQQGSINVLRQFYSIEPNDGPSSEVVEALISNGHVIGLQWLETRGYNWRQEHYSLAAEENLLDILVSLRTHSPSICSWDGWCYAYAAANGHLKILDYLKKEECPYLPDVATFAAENGRLDVLEWLVVNNFPLHASSYIGAVSGDYIDIVKFLYNNDCPWNEDACVWAAASDRLDILDYLAHHAAGRRVA